VFIWQWIAVFSLTALMALPGQAAEHSEPVDLELILAVDVSRSMNARRLKLQRDGYVAAFRDPRIAKAISMGPQGRIAVTYVEWSGADNQSVLVPWRVIASQQDAMSFADDLAEQKTTRTRRTSISAMLIKARQLFAQNRYRGLRRVVDVSGDGPNNSGPPVVVARDGLLADGVVINGLPIISEPDAYPGYYEPVDIDDYYRDCVIGGPGSFFIPVESMSNFAKAIRMKMILEIAGLTTPERARPLLRRVGYQPANMAGPTDCMIAQRHERTPQVPLAPSK
jgi:hypothetical protein